jgi:transcriptional regulator with XRE-family HTH domain
VVTEIIIVLFYRGINYSIKVSVNDLGIVIKKLIRGQEFTGQELANRIGIGPPNLSQIVNGHAKPREGTFSKLCEVLGNDKKDEKLLVDAFLRLKEGAPEVVPVDPEASQRAEIERAERFLEMKAQSIAFRRSVGRELDAAGFSFEADYCSEIYATDFFVNKRAKHSKHKDKSKNFFQFNSISNRRDQ